MRYLSFFFALGLSTVAASAQDLVVTDSVHFDSPFEKHVFEDIRDRKPGDYFDLFIASGGLLDESRIESAKTTFYQNLIRLERDNELPRRNDKKLKFIQDYLYKQYLRKFNQAARFEDLFVNGEFNHTSAAALLALTFDQFRIPYTIKMYEGSPHLLATPDGESFKIEPLGSGGTFGFTDEFKNQFVKMLLEQKIVSMQEYERKSKNQLFEDFYINNGEIINLKTLASGHYREGATIAADEKKFTKAISQMEKAWLLEQSDLNAYLLMVLHARYLESLSGVFNTRKAALIGRISRFSKYGITSEMLMSDLAAAMDNLLFQQRKTDATKQFYEALTKPIPDSSIRKDLSYVYNYEFSRFYYNEGKYAASLPYAEQALESRPQSSEASQLFVNSLLNKTQYASTAERASLLLTYQQKFPVLNENNYFISSIGLSYLQQMQSLFDQGDPAGAEKFLSLFEKLCSEHPDHVVPHEAIGEAFGTGITYYFRKGNTTKAKAMVQKGLTLAPESQLLQMRKRMLN